MKQDPYQKRLAELSMDELLDEMDDYGVTHYMIHEAAKRIRDLIATQQTHSLEGIMPRSQAQAINEPPHETWEEYRKGCLSTFGGGYHDDGMLGAFQHGMNTVFNLLETEFPSPKEIFDNQQFCLSNRK
jgi:hypothetical protein